MVVCVQVVAQRCGSQPASTVISEVDERAGEVLVTQSDCYELTTDAGNETGIFSN